MALYQASILPYGCLWYTVVFSGQANAKANAQNNAANAAAEAARAVGSIASGGAAADRNKSGVRQQTKVSIRKTTYSRWKF